MVFRKKGRQIRADEEFARKLDEISRSRIARNLDRRQQSSREVTRMILRSKSFERVERELTSEEMNPERILRGKRKLLD